MDTMQLYTRDGSYVHTVYIPHFNPRVDFLVWGTRMFIWNDVAQQYREAVGFYCIESLSFSIPETKEEIKIVPPTQSTTA